MHLGSSIPDAWRIRKGKESFCTGFRYTYDPIPAAVYCGRDTKGSKGVAVLWKRK